MPDGAGRAKQVGQVALAGLAVVVWWVVPLVRPRGAYGGGHYRLTDIQIGFVAAVAWLGWLAVAVAPPSRRRPRAVRLIALGGALLVATIVGDLAATVWTVRFGHFWHQGNGFAVHDNVRDPELIWKHRPNLSWRGRKSADCQSIDFRTDENGFRNPPGIRRADLVFIGDSVTEAGEVAEDATFVRKTAGATGLSAVNLGVFSYGPQQELVVLKRHGLAYQPKAVVWQFTEWNDLENAEGYLGRDEPWAANLPPWRTLYERYSPVAQLINFVFPPRHRHLVDFQRTDGTIDQRAVWPYLNPVPSHPAGLREAARSIVAARAFCRERGVAFVVLFVPLHTRILAPYARPKTPGERDRYDPSGGLDRLDDPAHALAAICREAGCPMIDLTGPFRHRAALDNRHLYIKNDTHLDAGGHDEAARALTRWLCSAEGLALGEKLDKDSSRR